MSKKELIHAIAKINDFSGESLGIVDVDGNDVIQSTIPPEKLKLPSGYVYEKEDSAIKGDGIKISYMYVW